MHVNRKEIQKKQEKYLERKEETFSLFFTNIIHNNGEFEGSEGVRVHLTVCVELLKNIWNNFIK